MAPQVASYITAPTALFNAGLQDIDNLVRRLGELRDDPQLGRGDAGAESFVRAYGGRFNYATNRSFTNYGYNSSQDYAALQFGGSRIVHTGDGGTLRIGLAGTLSELWIQPNAADGASKALFHTETLAGIMTWLSRRGWYVDVIVSGGMFDGQVKTPAMGQVAGLNGTSFNLSLEGGYPIALGWQQLVLEPQAQVVFEHLDFARRTDADDIALNLGSPDQGILRMGARLTRPFTGADGIMFTPYLKANVLQGLGGGNAVRLSGVAFGTGDFGTALQVGGGITGGLSRHVSLYGEVAWQQSVGNGGFRGWALNGGVRVSF